MKTQDVYASIEALQSKTADASREAQNKIREMTESVDNLARAKELLEPKGMTVVNANVEAFRALARQKVWPAYKQQYASLWDEVENFKA